VVGVRQSAPPSSGRWRPAAAAVGAAPTAGCGCCAATSVVGAALALDAAPPAYGNPISVT
jgi:hypothetical protein